MTAASCLRGVLDVSSHPPDFGCVWLATIDSTARSRRERHILLLLINTELSPKNQLEALSFSSKGVDLMVAGEVATDHDCKHALNKINSLFVKKKQQVNLGPSKCNQCTGHEFI